MVGKWTTELWHQLQLPSHTGVGTLAAALGLKQVALLCALAFVADSGRPSITAAELARMAGCTSDVARRRLARLERGNWVAKSPTGNRNERGWCLFL